MTDQTVTRRARFLSASAVAALAPFAVVKAPARAAPFSYKLAHDMTLTDPLHLRQVECWDAIKRETNGQLDVTIFGKVVTVLRRL